ncbi:MAG: hypothetical protein COA58_02995 [Bacteroidetes bacterium]|nr:MAG: hypothetical protein COA58_02995 [Bacteroidota bacterium]
MFNFGRNSEKILKNFFTEGNTTSVLEQNKINGKSAERFFAATLTVSLEARIFWASRTEDDSKVDLVSILTHPWINNTVQVIFTQIKSGNSYCEIVNETLKVKKLKFRDFINRNHHTLICWTSDDDIPYWFIIKANSRYFKTEYPKHHRISPAMRFDITRILASSTLKNGGKGLAFSCRSSAYDKDSFKQLRKTAKVIYKKLKLERIDNPLLGEIKFTRLAWRHITRESRLNEYKVASFEIFKILGLIISETPTNHYILKSCQKENGDFNYRENEYLLVYDNVRCYDKTNKEYFGTRIYMKLLEFIEYQNDWMNKVNASAKVKRKVIFKSIYYKNT